MKLAIISHTEHYHAADGTIVGWGPTVSEINHLLGVFDEIFHVAMIHNKEAPPSAIPYASDKITFVPIPPSGGPGPKDKLMILGRAPSTINIVFKTLRKVDVFQFRAPTGIGVYLIPLLMIFTKKRGWFKYAGNWNQQNPPIGYAIQRKILKNQSRKVTINGQWKNQPSQCITFENPCLTNEDIKEGLILRNSKILHAKKTFCFVGRLETEKGVKLIIDSFQSLSNEQKTLVDKVHLIGDGKERSEFESMAKNSGVNFIFHGFKPRVEVFKVYENSQFFLLPSSASEGFPKVIAEAMNFGCVPIVSKVSSINQYIKQSENGFIVDPVSKDNLVSVIDKALNMENATYNEMKDDRNEVIRKFTYTYYNDHIKNAILVNDLEK